MIFSASLHDHLSLHNLSAALHDLSLHALLCSSAWLFSSWSFCRCSAWSFSSSSSGRRDLRNNFLFLLKVGCFFFLWEGSSAAIWVRDSCENHRDRAWPTSGCDIWSVWPGPHCCCQSGYVFRWCCQSHPFAPLLWLLLKVGDARKKKKKKKMDWRGFWFCAGQVHRATFRGEEVVIKVQRPGLKALFDIDLKNLRVRLFSDLFSLPHLWFLCVYWLT